MYTFSYSQIAGRNFSWMSQMLLSLVYFISIQCGVVSYKSAGRSKFLVVN